MSIMKNAFAFGILLLLLCPLAFSVTSNTTCVNNNTIRETNYYNFQITENASEDVNFTQSKDIYCDYGCVQTSNTTAQCKDTPMNAGLLIAGIFVAVIILIVVVLRLSGFK